MLTIAIKYFSDVPEIEMFDKGDWIDLRSAEDVKLKKGEFKMIPLGVGMILPDDYEALVVPRSSTFKKYKILMTNSVGVIDNAYSGDNDQWHFPCIATEDTFIPKGDRICQFRIEKKMEKPKFVKVDHLHEISRGGFGSTGTN